MTITIGSLEFDHVDYDTDGDVLYLSIGPPRLPADSHGTPEGHNVRHDDDGNVIALTIVNAKRLIERHGAIDVTIPSRVPGDVLAPALG